MKICERCNEKFAINEEDKLIYSKISPVFNEQKFLISEPTFCPACRQQQRLPWRNERSIYKRNCDLCKKSIISEYSPDKSHTVYCQDCFWSDKWSPFDYGKDFDFKRSFNEQFKELIERVPLLALINTKTQNSEYCHRIFNGRNNYLSFIALYDPEELLYTHYTMRCKHSADLTYCRDIDWSYELTDCQHCYECFYSKRLKNCNNTYFSEDCIGCDNCFGCKNLVHKSYCIFNKQYSKEEYLEFIKNAALDRCSNIQKYKKESSDFFLTQPSKNIIAINCENCSGANLGACKNCRECFDIYEAEDMKYCVMGECSHDCFDCDGLGPAEHSSHSITLSGSNNIHFCATVVDSNNLWYSYACYANSSNSFGCVGLKRSKYCVLNKQYSKEAYEKLVVKIIEHMQKTKEWGQFFTPNLSPFGYNETTVQEYFPLTKEQAVSEGFNWSDYVTPPPDVEKVISSEKLPESIKDVPDEVLNWAIKCERSKKLFKITSQELNFYRKYKIPIPRKHPDERHSDRMDMRISRRLWERHCDKCKQEIFASYAPDFQGIVYCENCYHQEVY